MDGLRYAAENACLAALSAPVVLLGEKAEPVLEDIEEEVVAVPRFLARKNSNEGVNLVAQVLVLDDVEFKDGS